MPGAGDVCYLFTFGELLELSAEAWQEFMEAVITTFAAAERHPGFLWRAESTLVFGDDGSLRGVRYDAVPSWLSHLPVGRVLQTLSAWGDLAAARDFAYRSAEHARALRKRRLWAAHTTHPVYVLWRAAAERPTWAEAVRRAELLDAHGPTVEAFDFRRAGVPASDEAS